MTKTVKVKREDIQPVDWNALAKEVSFKFKRRMYTDLLLLLEDWDTKTHYCKNEDYRTCSKN